MAVQVERWLFTVDEFHRLVETGFLKEDDRVELINGELIRMAPIGSFHLGSVIALDEFFRERLGRRVTISNQGSVVLGPRVEPQPDLVLLKRRDDHYVSALPVPADVLLLIEVSDTTLEYDRQVKGQMYAEAGITDYWIINLSAQQVEVRRVPTADGYESVRSLGRSDQVAPLAFPDLTVAVSDILLSRPDRRSNVSPFGPTL